MAPVHAGVFCAAVWKVKARAQKRPLAGNSWGGRKQQKYCNGSCFFAQIG